jgi:molybdenum cofactor guanylyltransferase
VIGAVLAGGVGGRLGQSSKPAALLGGRPLASYPVEALAGVCELVAVVCKSSTELPELPGAERWDEPDEPRHPLTGIVHALETAGGPVLVCACDMPFVSPALARALADVGAAIALPRAGGRLHPVLARYTPAVLPALRTALARGQSLHQTVADLMPAILDEQELAPFGDPARLLFNVNTPADLERAEAMLDTAGRDRR